MRHAHRRAPREAQACDAGAGAFGSPRARLRHSDPHRRRARESWRRRRRCAGQRLCSNELESAPNSSTPSVSFTRGCTNRCSERRARVSATYAWRARSARARSRCSCLRYRLIASSSVVFVVTAHADGRHHQVIAALLARHLEPVQQARFVGASAQSHADHEHVIELEPLGAVNRHQRDGVRLRRIFGIQPGHQPVEIERAAAQAFAVFFVERREESARMRELAAPAPRTRRRAPARRAPTMWARGSRSRSCQAASSSGFARSSRSTAVRREPGNVAEQRGQDRGLARRFADHREIGEREPDERRAQHRQPCHAVERRFERAHQRFEIAHHRDIGQRLELHADERHRRAFRGSRGRRADAGARPPAPRWIRRAARVSTRRSDPRRVRLRPAGPQSPVDAVQARLAAEIGARGDAGQVPHRALAHVVGGRKHAREHVVAPVHQRRRRAEIAPQLQRRQCQAARVRRRAPSRSGPPRRCESRRWTASDRRPGTGSARRRPTSPA